jgi:hypothetical protein
MTSCRRIGKAIVTDEAVVRVYVRRDGAYPEIAAHQCPALDAYEPFADAGVSEFDHDDIRLAA